MGLDPIYKLIDSHIQLAPRNKLAPLSNAMDGVLCYFKIFNVNN